MPEHVKKAAREMGQRAFKQRLREIQMSEYDAQLYGQFSDAVSRQVIVTCVFRRNFMDANTPTTF